MTEYRHKMRMHAEPEAIFAFVADLRNLPKYLPMAEHVRAGEDGGEAVRVEGRLHDQRFGSEGYFRADPAKLRLDWGAEGDRYAGSLAINPLDEVSEVVIELRIDEPPPGVAKAPSKDEVSDSLVEGLHAIQNHVEGRLHKEAGRRPS